MFAQVSEVRAVHPVEGTVLGLAAPSHTGDVTVFYAPTAGGPTAYTVLAPKEDVQTQDPLRIFLFTTIEEPSDANLSAPCTGSGATFESELKLVRNNAAVLATLGDLHTDVDAWLAPLTAGLPRLARYGERLAAAAAAAAAGDGKYVASPRVDSYHGAWFELHEDLILLAGCTRADEVAAGRA